MAGDADGDSVTGEADGSFSIAFCGASSSLLLQGVLGKQANPSGHSELLPPGHGLRQLVDAS